MSPRPVCVPCGREMSSVQPVVVELHARSIGAYQQWHGDQYTCDECGATIVAGYGDGPSWQHFQPKAGRQVADVVVPERSYRGPRGDAPANLR